MEYIFGSVRRNGVLVENLKTVGDAHTDYSGYVSTRTELGDGTVVIDRCRVVEHYHAEEDAEGKCYDWYVIDQHYRYMDTAPLAQSDTANREAVEQAITDLYLDGIQAQQDITDIQLQMLGG